MTLSNFPSENLVLPALQDLYQCYDCELSSTRFLPVPGSYSSNNHNTRIVLIGEGPGDIEDKNGKPFIGESGKLLRDSLKNIDFFITNTVKCRTPNNRDPSSLECRSCRRWLDQELNHIQPTLIILCGKVALKQFFPKESLSKTHGTSIEKDGIIYIPMYHPAAGLRSSRFFNLYSSDILHVLNVVNNKYHKYSTGNLRINYDLDSIIKDLEKVKEFAFDVETTILNPLEADIIGISFCWNEDEAVYYPVDNEQKTIMKLKRLLISDNIRKICHNLKYEWSILYNKGIEINNGACTQVLAYLLGNPWGSQGLKDLSRRYLGVEMTRLEELIGKGKKQIPITEIPIEKLGVYGAADSLNTYRLYKLFYPQLKNQGFIYEAIELPLIKVLAKMELDGILVSQEKILSLKEPWKNEILKLEEEILEEVVQVRMSKYFSYDDDYLNPDIEKEAYKFNINSPSQLGNFLFNELGLIPTKLSEKTKKPSTDKGVLDDLKFEHPIINKIRRYRELQKLLGTYIENLLNEIDPITGRIYAQFNQTVAETGRLSSGGK